MQQYFQEFKRIDLKKKTKELIKMLQLELAESNQTVEDAVAYEVQKLTDPNNLTIDSIPVIKSLTPKDLEAMLTKYFSKPPTTWILVKTNKTENGGN